MRYIKEVFDVQTLPQAMNVVLTTDPSRPDKFQRETQLLVDAIAQHAPVTSQDRVLDFGCGMGRISRAMIERFGCHVTGVDISESMLKFAMLWVSDPKRFSPGLDMPEPASQDMALAVFVLQHAEDPAAEIDRIYQCLRPGGILVLVNENVRYVPGDLDQDRFIVWQDDGVDIHGLVSEKFKKIKSLPYLDTQVRIEFYEKS